MELDTGRRRILAGCGLGAAGLVGRGLGGAAASGLLQAVLAQPARGDVALDVQILQTASSLERLAVDAYTTVLAINAGGMDTLPGSAGQSVRSFLLTAAAHHEEHRKAFQAQTAALGGALQESPNPKFQGLVASRLPRLTSAVDVLELAVTLEKVVCDTYLVNLAALEDPRAKEIAAGVMGVEAQHQGVLRAVAALLRAQRPELVKVPLGVDVSRLPRTALNAAFPDALERVNPAELLAQPETGAVR